jgi:glyoxylase I family protein
MLHHVSLPVADLERSRAFYRDVLGLREIDRPPFDFPGAWFAVGDDAQLHLIGDPPDPSHRGDKPIDSRDVHFAVRVASYSETLSFLESLGYRSDVDRRDGCAMIVRPHATAGFPQIYIVDPDRNVIELNAAQLDTS